MVSLRMQSTFYSRSVSSASLLHLVPKIRELISHNIQALGSLPEFKNATKFWKPVRCPCTICKTYIPPNGFVYWMQFYTFVLIIYCVEYGNFAWFLVGGNYRAWVVFRDFWAIPPRVSRNFLFQGLLTGGSGEVFVFLKVVLSVFYIIILSGTW